MSASEDLDNAIQAASKLKKFLSRRKSRQVTSVDECSMIKATAQAWFKAHRAGASGALPAENLRELDGSYRNLLESSERHATRVGYGIELKLLHKRLVKARSSVIAVEADRVEVGAMAPPDFAKLIPDPAMQTIISRRWD